MATYSNNTTIKIGSGTTTVTRTGDTGGTTTHYTCPANSYADVYIYYINTTGSGSVTVANRVSTGTFTFGSTNHSTQPQEMRLSPGQTVASTSTFSNAAYLYCTIVEFTNSP